MPETITFQAPTELSKRLKIRAAQYGISRSQALREAALKWLDRTPPFCIICEQASTFPRDGAWYCPKCGKTLE